VTDLDPESAGLAGRLSTNLPAKIGVWLGLAAGICVPYFTLQRLRLLPLRQVPETAVDAAIGLWPAFLWPYLSIALLVPLAPLLARDPSDLRRYARGLALLCVPCFLIFALVPVEGPRPDLAPDHPLYRWLVSVDRPTNSLPSLHAGLAVYSLLYAWRVLRDDLYGARRWGVWLAGAVWGALILVSTLATKQHWLVDLPPGALLAWAAHHVTWRSDP
jgi:membrane-associated phospholipid phosphatase